MAIAMERHALSLAFPQMPADEVRALSLDIQENGQLEPGILFEGKILDGWHRYLACEMAGVEFKAKDLNGQDPVAYVISKNARRRHATLGQIAVAVAECIEWREKSGRPRNTAESADALQQSKTIQDVAQNAGVSTRTMATAKSIVAAGLGDYVRDGAMPIQTAATIAKLPAPERKKAVDSWTTGKRPVPIVNAKPDPKDAKIAALEAENAELQEKNQTIAEEAELLQAKLDAFSASEPDEQQKLILELQNEITGLKAEIQRLRIDRQACLNKNNELIRQIRNLQKRVP